MEQHDLRTLAKGLSFDQKKRILSSFSEVELHPHLRRLLVAMEPDSIVEITHGTEEFGKDLVMVNETKFGRQVDAIVVKTGTIGGKTMGKVDEIVSQVEQCFQQPAMLRTVIGPLPVQEVWIMVAGELTKNGQRRLNASLKDRNVKPPFDMKWLVEHFTEYYPQVFFEGEVIDFLKGKILELEKRRMLSKYSPALSESWVEPMVASLDSPIAFNEGALVITFEKGRLPFSQLRQFVLPERNRIILAGDPGTGKSTALAKLALDMLKEAFNLVIKRKLKEGEKVAVPLLILARDIANIEEHEDLLSHYIPSEAIDRFHVNLLLVDGLDEVRADLREKVIEKVTKFSQDLGCSAILASRKIEIVENPLVTYRKFELLPFDFGKALELLDKLVVSDTRLLDVLREGLEKIKFQILMTPLSLSLLIEIAENYREIPASLTELYDRFTDIALGRFDREKGIEVLFDYEIKKRLLAELAFICFLEEERLEIPKSVFDSFMAQYATRHRMDENRLQVLIHEIERAGLLDIQETVSFCHRSFLDYFAAYSVYLRQDKIPNLDDLITQLYFSDAWGDVAFFYIGMKREIKEETVTKIVLSENKGLKADIDRILIGRLLQAGWFSPSEIKISAIRQSLSFAPGVKNALLRLAEEQHINFPKIFGDFLVLALCEIALVSAFLENEERQLFDELSKEPDTKNLYSSLLLLWATRKFLSSDQLSLLINELLHSMSKIHNLTSVEQARILLLCSNIETQDKATRKAIKRKLDRLKRRNPAIFKGLLPEARKGSRRSTSRIGSRAGN